MGKRKNREIQPLSSAAKFDGLNELFGETSLGKDVNEIFLIHGCKWEAAQEIMKSGFDIRYTNSGGNLYGDGLYFTKDVCKADQYTDQSGRRCIVISRVAPGDPVYVTAQYAGKHPPPRDPNDLAKGRFDSIVVDPARSQRGQAHWEYVLFESSQAYPELLVEYTL